MHCHNCEIPLDWDGFSPIVVCDICRTFRFVDTPDGSGDCIIPLNQAGQSHCPCCRRQMIIAAMDGLKVEHCAGCHGVLLDESVFTLFVRNRRSQFREAALQPAVHVSGLGRRHVNCPSCRRTMDAHPSYGPNLMIIDCCVHCGVVWLDCRETTITRPVSLVK